MTIIFQDDFESGDANFTKWSGKIVSAGETISLTTPGINGQYAAIAACDGVETSEWSYLQLQLASPGLPDFWGRVYAVFDKLPTRSDTDIPLMVRASYKTGMTLAYVSITTNGLFELRYIDATGGHYMTSSLPVTFNTAYRLELHVRVSPIGASTGLAELYVNGTLVASVAGIDNSKSHATNETCGTGNGTTTVFYFGGTQKKLPIAGTEHILLNGVEQTTGFTVNYATGAITFTVAPATGVVVSATYDFLLGNASLVQVGERRWMSSIPHRTVIDNVAIADSGPIGPYQPPITPGIKLRCDVQGLTAANVWIVTLNGTVIYTNTGAEGNASLEFDITPYVLTNTINTLKFSNPSTTNRNTTSNVIVIDTRTNTVLLNEPTAFVLQYPTAIEKIFTFGPSPPAGLPFPTIAAIIGGTLVALAILGYALKSRGH